MSIAYQKETIYFFFICKYTKSNLEVNNRKIKLERILTQRDDGIHLHNQYAIKSKAYSHMPHHWTKQQEVQEK
jgi:hypothetical protein